MFRSYTENLYRPIVKSSAQSRKLQWFSCDLCKESEENLGALWYSETDVEIHRKEVHFGAIISQMMTNGDRFCTVCMTLLESKDMLLPHIKTRHLLSSPCAQRIEREVFICDYCNHIFFNKHVLQTHVQVFHLWQRAERKLKTCECPNCHKTCLVGSIWYHLQVHEIPSLSVCDICFKSCLNIKELMTHLKEHSMFYKCEVCCYQTVKERLFESHLDEHRHKPSNRTMNKLKMKNYVNKAFLKPVPKGGQMKYNIHNPIKGLALPTDVHICVLCREICNDQEEMWEHVWRAHSAGAPAHAGGGAPRLRCACGLRFPSRVLLKHHLFKHGPTHRDVTDESSSQPSKATTEPEYSMNVREPEWLAEPTFEIEVHHGEPCAGGLVAGETVSHGTGTLGTVSQSGDETSGEEVVYIYAMINDSEPMAVEQDSEQSSECN